MKHSMEKSVRSTRFEIADLQKRIEVLEATRDDLRRQMGKLQESVPEMDVEPGAQKEGYVAYGSYAQSVIARKENLQATLDDIEKQNGDLTADLRIALSALDSFERVRARQLAAKAERSAKRA
jgi:flagellar protein FliJ